MKCGKCERECEAHGLVSLTSSVHEVLCADCSSNWTRYAKATRADQNTNGARLRKFREWMEVRT